MIDYKDYGFDVVTDAELAESPAGWPVIVQETDIDDVDKVITNVDGNLLGDSQMMEYRYVFEPWTVDNDVDTLKLIASRMRREGRKTLCLYALPSTDDRYVRVFGAYARPQPAKFRNGFQYFDMQRLFDASDIDVASEEECQAEARFPGFVGTRYLSEEADISLGAAEGVVDIAVDDNGRILNGNRMALLKFVLRGTRHAGDSDAVNAVVKSARSHIKDPRNIAALKVFPDQCYFTDDENFCLTFVAARRIWKQ